MATWSMARRYTRPGFVVQPSAATALSGQFARLAPGVGILHLTAERMLVWPMIAPPLRVQVSIVAEVDRRLSIVREVEAEVDANLKRAHAAASHPGQVLLAVGPFTSESGKT